MGEAIGTIFMFLILNIRENYFRSFNFRIEKKELLKLINLGLVYSFALLVITLNYRIDTILLDKLSNSYQVGIYSRGASLIQYLWQIPMLMDNIVFTRGMAGNFDAAFSKRVCVLMRLSVVWISVACIFILFWGSEIVELLYGKEFHESSIIMVYLIPGVIILTVYRVLNMDAASKGNPWLAIQAMTPALILNIGLNLYFIPAYGAVGAAISSSISYVSATLFYVFLYSKKAQMPVIEIFRFSISDFSFLKNSLRSQKTGNRKTNGPEF
jgi:O-antigen/teichoic acid export membrane protein